MNGAACSGDEIALRFYCETRKCFTQTSERRFASILVFGIASLEPALKLATGCATKRARQKPAQALIEPDG
jgi:hypothetical protein